MNNITKKSTLIVAISCLMILFTFSGCGSGGLDREYYDDLNISLETQDGEIIIKEWEFLLGSGAEVYYRENGKDILLGKLSGSDDGFCPFKEGLYELTQEGNTVTIKWCFKPSDKDKTNWRSDTFELPQ